VVVFWSLLVEGQSFVVGDVAIEVVTCRSYCDPIVIDRVSCRPPEFYPATAFSVKDDGVIPLCGWSFCIVSNRLFPRYPTSLYCPPPDASYQVS
jgi:hypothetical protein